MNTGCEFHGDALADLAAGRLDEGRRERTREHLTGCAACREDYAILAALAAAPAAAPPGLEERIRLGVRDALAVPAPVAPESGHHGLGSGAQAGIPRPASWRAWALPAAAAAVLAVLWVAVPRSGPAGAPTPEAESLTISSELDEPYGAWPATGPEVAGEPVLSDLRTEDLELLLEEMQP